MPAVPDASPLIALGKIERIELLSELYDQVLITPWVWEEAVSVGKAMGARDAALVEKAARESQLTKIRLSPAETELAEQLKQTGTGAGEAEVLAVAKRRAALAILDDKAARAAAVGMEIDHVGTAGVLFESFIRRLIDYEQLLELMEKLGNGEWISPELLAGIIRKAREVRGQ